jgi:uncharacterized membrane protein
MIGPARRRLLKMIDQERILAAIREAELRTSGEIRVSVSHFFWGGVSRAAERAFVRMGMTNTRNRNGILFFIVPSRRRFSIQGDSGIHAAVGQEFWDSLAVLIADRFRKKEFTLGLVEAITAAGEKLALHFPYDAATDVNELPDEIDFGGSGKTSKRDQ